VNSIRVQSILITRRGPCPGCACVVSAFPPNRTIVICSAVTSCSSCAHFLTNTRDCFSLHAFGFPTHPRRFQKDTENSTHYLLLSLPSVNKPSHPSNSKVSTHPPLFFMPSQCQARCQANHSIPSFRPIPSFAVDCCSVVFGISRCDEN
jgi:hypothetical protein